MKAMLLAAGFGKRMLPLTLTVPKAAIPVLGRPMAVQILQRMLQCGVTTAILNLHHLPEAMRRLLVPGNDCGLPEIEFSHESELLGTAGGLRQAGDRLRGDGPILVHNSDSLSDFDLDELAQAHARSGNLVTLVLVPSQPGYSTIEVDGEGTVLSLAGRPEASEDRVAGRCVFTGVQLIEEEVLDLIPAEAPSDIVRDVYWGLAESGRIGSHVHPGFWWEFGSPERYLAGSFRLLDSWAASGVRSIEHDPVHRIDGAIVAVGPGATHHEQAGLLGHVALGFASYVSEESTIEETVVMPEAWIGPQCRLKEVIVGPGTEVPAGFEARNAIVCADPGGDEELPDSVERSSGLLIHPFGPSPS